MITRSLITRRWAPEVLLALADGPRHFNRLLKIQGISDRMLFVRLTELIDADLITRLVDPGPPIRVTYELTDGGRRYIPVLSKLKEVVSQAG